MIIVKITYEKHGTRFFDTWDVSKAKSTFHAIQTAMRKHAELNGNPHIVKVEVIAE